MINGEFETSKIPIIYSEIFDDMLHRIVVGYVYSTDLLCLINEHKKISDEVRV